MTMISRYLRCAGREMHFTEWGAQNKEVVICWHGLTRTGRDFDALAQVLSQRYRVICPDALGRGLSEWAVEPEREYNLGFYAAMVLDLCRQLHIDQLRWVGTSMGGLLAIVLASNGLKGRITHLVLNDIGPEIPAEARQRITDYAAKPPVFDALTALEQWVRKAYAPFGLLSDSEWRQLAEGSSRRTDGGRITLHYDPRLVIGRSSAVNASLDLWDAYDLIQCKTLLLRGEASDILTTEIAEAMTQRGPRCEQVEIKHCGHAPMLNLSAQQNIVKTFLD